MKNDFTSVIVERARYGRTRVHPKTARFNAGLSLSLNLDSDLDLDLDLGQGQDATHQSMNAPWRHNRKEKRIHLAPLRRFLRAQVGRPWNDVYSDVCHTFKGVVSNGDRLTNYIDWDVELNVRVRESDGELITERGYSVGGNTLYVHPESGILTLSPTSARRRYKRKPRFEMVSIDNEHKLVNIDGLWYVVTLATIPGDEVSERPFDVVLGRAAFAGDIKYSWDNDFHHTWGGCRYAAQKRQANSREIRRLVTSDSSSQDLSSEKSSAKGNKKKFKVHCYRPQGRR
ncbi:MAG: hypothetical protein WC714_17835 [Candidatus Obscuribacterales bacterium]|jgi:hypothetical protein